MTAKLALYNGALRLCGERRLASLTENREPRRYLDEVWADDFVKGILEKGTWKFALRSTKLDPDSNVTVEFGHTHAFAKPDDMVRIAAVSSDEFFNTPLLAYNEEQSWLFSSTNPLYLRYVSSDTNYGADMSRWTKAFSDFAEADLALAIIKRLTQDKSEWDRLAKLHRSILTIARSLDAMADPTKFLPRGDWVSSRIGGNLVRRDGGNRGGLIG